MKKRWILMPALLLGCLFHENSWAESTSSVFKDLDLVVMIDSHNMDSFRGFADQCKRFDSLANVKVNISGLADKAFYNLPETGRNPWYEYTSWNSTMYHFFPHSTIKPYIPGDFVKKNQKLLMEKADYLRQFGLEAAFWTYEPRYLPSEFFDEYPSLLGARVDHPRRSHKPAFGLDVDEPAVLDMYTEMTENLFAEVPELGTFVFKINDAGSGINWAGLQYDTPNGPSKHRFRSSGERLSNFINACNKGISNSCGQTVPVYFEPRFQWPEETAEVISKLPANAMFFKEFVNDRNFLSEPLNERSMRHVVHTTDGYPRMYPVRYVFNPLRILQGLQQLKPEQSSTLFMDLSSWYERGGSTVENSGPFFDVVYDFIQNPVYGRIEVLERLRELCHRWSDDGEELFKVFCDLNDAFTYADGQFSAFTGIHGYVSMRLITRPCLIMPEKLTTEEEQYFLPYVFNLSEGRARMNYMDNLDMPVLYTWSRREEIWPYQNRVRIFIARIHSIASRLEQTEGPLSDYLEKSAAGLRVYGSMIRTWENFYKMQALREQNAEKLQSAPHLPPQGSFSWQGDVDLTFMKQALRDEVENVTELLEILQAHPDVIYTASEKRHEDIFLLGPDLMNQLKMKRRLMLKHYTDADMYLTAPLK